MHNNESQEAAMDSVSEEKGNLDRRVAFSCVPSHIIDSLCTSKEWRVSYYDKEGQLIILKMLSQIHEIATNVAEKMLLAALKRVNMEDAFLRKGAATAPYWTNTPRGKQPDASYSLRPCHTQDRNLRGWPQIVIETGFSETSNGLLADVRYWMEKGEGIVRVVMTVNISKDAFELEAWMIAQPKGTEKHQGQVANQGKIIADLVGNEYQIRQGFDKITIPFTALFFAHADTASGQHDTIELRGDDFMASKKDLEDLLIQGNMRPEDPHLRDASPVAESPRTAVGPRTDIANLPDKQR
ncbi:hypothetical protein KEM54_001929 [Ascosphaera aggregata]|nr:hypothetical protein KEM54_001929 [Ascosphaera aggregata]